MITPGYKRIVWIGFALLITACSSTQNNEASEREGFSTLMPGLQIRTTRQGTGDSAGEGDTVWIRETAMYLDSTLLYSNESSSSSIPVVLGAGQATEGEDLGIRGMQAGEVREMIIAPALSKRETYPENLSPDSTIIVRVILDSVN